MAAPARSFHGTTTAATPDPVTLNQPYYSVMVINRQATPTAANEIYFTVDGSTPSVGGAGTYVVPGVYGATLIVPVPTSSLGVQPNSAGYSGTTVNLISTNATAFSVIGIG